jgi:hypothetical protein
MGQWFADEIEFANRGKLTWQTGKLILRYQPILFQNASETSFYPARVEVE